jgi:hypothetical protein
MNPINEPIQCRVGDQVFGSDDNKIGKVAAFDQNVLTVEHGLLSKSHYFVPVSAVNTCNDGKVYLNVSKSEVEAQGWNAPPMMDTDATGRSALG